MAERTSSRRVGASLFNWLSWLDKEVRKVASGADWLQHAPFQFNRCRLFLMVRHPHLRRPFPDEILYQEVARAENQVSGHPQARHALDGLNDQQRKELAALFLDTIDSLRSYGAHRRRTNRVHKLAGDAPRQVRKLTRKLEKAARVLEDLRNYAASLDELLGWERERAAKICLKTLRKLKEDLAPEFYESIRTEYPALENPVTLGMVQLYWFFRNGCRLAGDEAEVRVARIRNAFWTAHGVSEVPYRPEYQTGESKGCDAVHVTILRFKQGTYRRRFS